jgi:hypothetical protein
VPVCGSGAHCCAALLKRLQLHRLHCVLHSFSGPPALRRDPSCTHHDRAAAAACRHVVERSLACTLMAHRSNALSLIATQPRAHQCGRYCEDEGCATGCAGNRVRCTPRMAPTCAAQQPLARVCPHDPAAACACRDAADRSLACALASHRSNALPLTATPTARSSVRHGMHWRRLRDGLHRRCRALHSSGPVPHRAATLGTCVP